MPCEPPSHCLGWLDQLSSIFELALSFSPLCRCASLCVAFYATWTILVGLQCPCARVMQLAAYILLPPGLPG